MKARGWTQQRLAQEAGVSANVVSRIRQGGSAEVSSLNGIARALGATLPQMLTEAGYGPADGSEADHPRVLDAIAADPDLLPEAKDHLTRQYGLLLRVRSDDVSARRARKQGAAADQAARRGSRDRGDLEE